LLRSSSRPSDQSATTIQKVPPAALRLVGAALFGMINGFRTFGSGDDPSTMLNL
jgi:hypothetical protein